MVRFTRCFPHAMGSPPRRGSRGGDVAITSPFFCLADFLLRTSARRTSFTALPAPSSRQRISASTAQTVSSSSPIPEFTGRPCHPCCQYNIVVGLNHSGSIQTHLSFHTDEGLVLKCSLYHATWVYLTFPRFRGHLVTPRPSSLRTRPGNDRQGSPAGAAD